MQKLLVTMTAHDPIERLLPCLEILARPGMTVIFLFQYPVDSWSYFRDHRITVESARHATAMGRKIANRYDWEAQKELAQQIIAPAVGALQNRGVQVVTHLRSGSLAKIIKNYSVDKEIQLIMTQFPRPGLIGYLSAKSVVPLGWSSYLLSVRSDPSFSEEQQQQGHTMEEVARLAETGALPAHYRCPASFRYSRSKSSRGW
jgi:hypothetical protein